MSISTSPVHDGDDKAFYINGIYSFQVCLFYKLQHLLHINYVTDTTMNTILILQFILWHAETLLGNDREISKYKTAGAK
jgi:hypothetical protein